MGLIGCCKDGVLEMDDRRKDNLLCEPEFFCNSCSMDGEEGGWVKIDMLLLRFILAFRFHLAAAFSTGDNGDCSDAALDFLIFLVDPLLLLSGCSVGM